MEATYGRALNAATQSVFTTMLRLPVAFGELSTTARSDGNDVTGVIGMTGDVVGFVKLGFPNATACKLVKAFTGADVTSGSEEFIDAIGELTNMVAGEAKAKLAGRDVRISCPSVVIGSGHRVESPSGMTIVSVPCQTACGEFVIEAFLRDEIRAAA